MIPTILSVFLYLFCASVNVLATSAVDSAVLLRPATLHSAESHDASYTGLSSDDASDLSSDADNAVIHLVEQPHTYATARLVHLKKVTSPVLEAVSPKSLPVDQRTFFLSMTLQG